MSQPESKPLPTDLGSPDAGFVAGVGAAVAVLFVSGAITVALAAGGSTSVVVGTVTTAATLGLVVGALLASGVDGLPERLGQRRRSLALPFLVPAAFALATPIVSRVPSIPPETVVGTGFGLVGTFLAALGVASMARTRYARAMAPDEPSLTVPRLHPNGVRRTLGIGVACLAGAVALGFVASSGGIDGVPRSSLAIAGSGVFVGVLGLSFIFVGLSHRVQFENSGENTRLHALLPDRTRRRVYGTDWSTSAEFDRSHLPTLRVHDGGLVDERPLGDRFVPWEDVTAVRLDESTLIVECRGAATIRCARSVIDDPETVAATLERRSDGIDPVNTGPRQGRETERSG
ncbi:PH domain-containing protein [Natrarchaeobius sp. A-rgal3]|uniref:PH domain-containing protein n=1 Tax=Natrarchaeobius versutus TaxID=1679078 RepID=UPI00351034FD